MVGEYLQVLKSLLGVSEVNSDHYGHELYWAAI
jgi:hypothetical protein